jgi:hypothetical protein
VRREWRDLVGSPHPQRHQDENLLEPVAVAGGEQPDRALFARPRRRTPQAQQVSLRRELARVHALAGADVVDGLFRRPIRQSDHLAGTATTRWTVVVTSG